jgi:hypothetical protein
VRKLLPASLLLLALIACSDTLPTAGGTLDETRVSGVYRGSVRLVHGGAVSEQPLPARSFTARVEGGAARAVIASAGRRTARSGTLVMVADAAGGEVRTTRRTFRDLQGQTHELVSVRAGARDLALTHFVNGHPRVQVTKRWSHEDGAWVLRGARVAMFDASGSREVASLLLSADDVRRAAPATVAQHGARWLRRVGDALGPAPLHAQEPTDTLGIIPNPDGTESNSCTTIKWRMAAYLALGVTFAATGNILGTTGALLGYWGAYDSGVAADCF